MENNKRPKAKFSDWVTFLSGEKFGLINSFMGLGSIAIAVLVFMASYAVIGWYKSIFMLLFITLMLNWYYRKKKKPTGKELNLRGELANKILDKIMSDQLNEEDDIRKEWLEGLERISKTPLPWYEKLINFNLW